ncbi:MAG: hypothetical protein ACXVAY_01695 [Mucilaginibacter sp.]
MQRYYIHCALYKLFTLLLLLGAGHAFGQLVPVSLTQRIDKASVIFEGKVTAKTSAWNPAHTQIYTSNIVAVYKVFKGSISASQVEIITPGGTVGNDMEQVSHSLQLETGQVGIFTAIPNPVALPSVSGLQQLKAYAGLQGFIKYDLATHTATDPFAHYKSIINEVYPAITRRTNAAIVTLKKADFTIE